MNENTLMANLVNISFYHNDLTDKIFLEIVDNLPVEILRELTISKNHKLTEKSYAVLGGMRFPCLAKLTLEDNLMTDKHITSLCEHVKEQMSIAKLNLSKNQITHTGAEKLAACLNKFAPNV